MKATSIEIFPSRKAAKAQTEREAKGRRKDAKRFLFPFFSPFFASPLLLFFSSLRLRGFACHFP
jgi:hypothetical protein